MSNKMLYLNRMVQGAAEMSRSVTTRDGNWVLLLQIEMFEEVSLQAELGAYVVALEVGGVHL